MGYGKNDRGVNSELAYLFAPGSGLDLQSASDTGLSTTDNLTSDATPTFDVSAGPYFRLYRDGVKVSGDFQSGASYTDATLTDGVYQYMATSVDAAGNESLPNAIMRVTIDTAGPALPPSAPDLQTLSDTGVSDTDNLTKDNTPTFDITGVSYYRVYRNGVKISGDYQTNASFTTAAQPDGAYDYTIRAVDVAGNESAPSDALSVTIDTVAPTAKPDTPDLQSASDTGISDTDNLTNDATPTFDLIAAPYFRVYRNGAAISGYDVGSSYTPSPQPDGVHAYTVRAVDAAGQRVARERRPGRDH